MDYIFEALKDRSILSIPQCRKKFFETLGNVIELPDDNKYFLKVRVYRFLDEYTRSGKEEKYKLLNELLNWFDEGIIQQSLKNEIIDYTKMKPGEYCERGNLVSMCPWCGRPGHVQDGEPDCYHVTTHIEKIGGALISQVLDGCHLLTGMEWENPGNKVYEEFM